MEIEQVMIDYFEGDTSTELERKMFSQISMDDSLIAEFKNFYLINNAMKASVNSFTTPTSVTNEIFRKLGYSIPPATKPKWALFSFLKNNRTLSHLLSAVVASALTVVIMLLFFFPEANDGVLSAKQSNAKVSQGSTSSLPIVTSKENLVNPAISHKRKYHPSVFVNTEENKIDKQSQSAQFEQKLTLSSIEPGSVYLLTNTQLTRINLSYDKNELIKPYTIAYREPLGMSVGFSNSPSWSMNKPLIQPNYISPFNNLCISFNFDVSPEIRIGAEVRQETYYTEYTGKELNDTSYLYQQQSNLTSISANTRFYFLEFGSFNPFFGINIGVNRGGFITRPGIGIEYQAYPDLAFMLGFEYTYFWFQHQNNWSGASKAGINYGVLIKF